MLRSLTRTVPRRPPAGGLVRRVATGTLKVVAGTTVAGTTGVAVYASTERGRGMKREIQFWHGVAPIVFDYYWHFASSSPYVKYQSYMLDRNKNDKYWNAKESSDSSSRRSLGSSTTALDTTQTNGSDLESKEDHEEERQLQEQEDQEQQDQHRIRRKQKLQELHERHAPEMLDVLLELKGLYIKLGQVLSVTALPVPESYRDKFRTLQSDVPGYEEFDTTVKPVLEHELGRPIDEVFQSIDPIPCGAASIGQAHKAILRVRNKKQQQQDDHGTSNNDASTDANEEEELRQVIVKVQYPDASWQIPADIQCVGDLLRLCVFFGVVDESAAQMSFGEFKRQFIAELDYDQERRNLEDVYQSTLDPNAPYQRRGVIVPFVYPEYCTPKVITMSYIPGPKLEEEARKQLEALGIDTKKGLRGLVRARTQLINTDDEQTTSNSKDTTGSTVITTPSIQTSGNQVKDKAMLSSPYPDGPHEGRETSSSSHRRGIRTIAQNILATSGRLIGVDTLLGTVRLFKQIQLWCTVATVQTIETIQSTPLVGRYLIPTGFRDWARQHATAMQKAQQLGLTREWIDALFDVHGHQIFELGCFNADAHPGNIILIDQDIDPTSFRHPDTLADTTSSNTKNAQLGLIDFGQCKRLTPFEQSQIARLIVSVANNESEEVIADAFRDLGIQTKNDSTEFLALFAKLMFGKLESQHLQHSWHQKLHKLDAVTYFPNQLSMVYRTSMLLRGLALSLQFNVSVGDLWKMHAQQAIENYDTVKVAEDVRSRTSAIQVRETKLITPALIRRMTTKVVVEDLTEYAGVKAD